MVGLRTAPGMRERSPGTWELIEEAGRDPVTDKRRQVSRIFRGTMRDAKKARAALLVEAGEGHHAGTGTTVEDLFQDWIVELRRKGRSPNTIHGYEKAYGHKIRSTTLLRPRRKAAPEGGRLCGWIVRPKAATDSGGEFKGWPRQAR